MQTAPVWLVIASGLVLVVAFFLPLVVIHGPISSEIQVSGSSLVRQLCRGSDGQARPDGPDNAVVARIKRELAGIDLPLLGPALLGLSALLLLAHYLALPFIAVQTLRRRLGAGWYLGWTALAIGYGVAFLAGAALTQRGLNQMAGHNLTQRVVSLFSKVVANVYSIDIGAGGIVILTSSIACAVLVASSLALRRA